MIKPLRPYQLEAMAKSDGKPGFAYYMEQRTGKTPTAIKDIEREYKRGNIDAAIIVVPKCIISDWVGAVEDESGFSYWFDGPCYAAGWSGRKVDPVLTSHGGEFMRVFVVNYDALIREKGEAWQAIVKMMAMLRVAIVFDESQRIKSHQAQRTKRALWMAARAAHVRLLSGTPAAESPLDYWTQGHAIGIKGWPTSFFAFRNRYAVTRQRQFPGRKAFTEVIGYQREDDLKARMDPYVYRITRREAWKDAYKEAQYSKLYVELGPRQQQMYNEMKKQLRTELEGQEVTAQLAITKLLRLQQITGGFVGTDDMGLIAIPDNQRIKTLIEYLEDVDGKVIIWCRYTAEVDAIVEALTASGRKPLRYDGKTSGKDREHAKAMFRAPGDNEYTDFVGNIAAGEVGLTLDAAGTTMYYSNHESLDKRLQSEDRPVSIDNWNQVVDMVARGTVDENIIKALREKRDLAATITGDELLSWI